MRVVVNEKYKSLSSEIDFIFPDFVIISGLNGAGKSHLLKAIEEKAAKIYSDEGVEIKNIKYVNSNSLTPNESYQVGRDSFTNEVNTIYHSLQSYVQQKRNQPQLTLQSQFSYNPRNLQIIENVISLKGKSVEEIEYDDISEQLPIYHNLIQDVFYQNFSAIFKRYSDKYDENAYNEFLKIKKDKNKNFLSEDKFIKKYGTPPWEFVNRIFEEANIGYSINDPIEGDRDTPYFFKLINKANNVNVNFSDLSSGEKVLMSLTLASYNSKFDVPFPEVLLLDEPDAPLHPSMAKQLLTVIQEVFVKEKQVKNVLGN